MLYQGWNDYELIYLINEGSELALNLMYLKYASMIKYKARSCGFYPYEIDDCLQEGLILLTSAIKSYKPSYKKTFYKYFELILLRSFWRLRKANLKTITYAVDSIPDLNSLSDNVRDYSSLFKGEELYIYKEIFIYNTHVSVISKKLGRKESQIYYEIKKIKEILREEFDLLTKTR